MSQMTQIRMAVQEKINELSLFNMNLWSATSEEQQTAWDADQTEKKAVRADEEAARKQDAKGIEDSYAGAAADAMAELTEILGVAGDTYSGDGNTSVTSLIEELITQNETLQGLIDGRKESSDEALAELIGEEGSIEEFTTAFGDAPVIGDPYDNAGPAS